MQGILSQYKEHQHWFFVSFKIVWFALVWHKLVLDHQSGKGVDGMLIGVAMLGFFVGLEFLHTRLVGSLKEVVGEQSDFKRIVTLIGELEIFSLIMVFLAAGYGPWLPRLLYLWG